VVVVVDNPQAQRVLVEQEVAGLGQQVPAQLLVL